jgi:hypothetical protein
MFNRQNLVCQIFARSPDVKNIQQVLVRGQAALADRARGDGVLDTAINMPIQHGGGSGRIAG